MTAWALRRREVTPLILAACMAGGAVRMLAVEEERQSAETLVRALEGPAPRVIRGTVRTISEYDPFHRTRFTLAEAVVTSGAAVISLPGYIDVSAISADAAPGLWKRRPSSVLSSPFPAPSGSRDRGEGEHFLPGDRVRLLATLSDPSGYRNFHGHDHREYLASRRTYAVARVTSEKLIRKEGRSPDLRMRIRSSLARCRAEVRTVLFRHMPGHEALLMEVLLFNDMRLLPESDERIFRESGTMHLFAVSGTHIALLALVLIAFFRAMRVGLRASWTATFALLFLYVWLLDFVSPALRSLLMFGGFVAGKWLGREVDGLSCLAFGVAVILLADPNAAWQPGFLLSLAGVLAILVFVPLGRHWFGNDIDRDTWPGWLKGQALDGLIVTVAIVVVLLPLQLFFFQQFNFLSPVANLLESALAVVVLASGIAVAVAGLLLPVLGDLFGAAAALVMHVSWLIARIAAGQSWAIMRVAELPPVAVPAYYAVLFSGYYLVRRDTPEFRPKSFARLTLHSCLGVAMLAAFALTPRFHQPLRIWFFDVGQGDSTLVQFPTGQSLLIDAGHVTPDLGRMVVGPQLRALGVWPLDELVATHADADHIGGIPWLLGNHAVGRLIEGTNRPAGNELIAALEEATSASGVRRLQVTAGTEVRLDALTTLEVLNPPAAVSRPSSDNDQSVVIRIRHGRFTALLMADAELGAEQRLVTGGIGTCDVLKVGHHGSRTSSGEEFLNAVRPAVAVISCGRKNRYGHPHRTVLSRLEALRCRVYRTDQDGAVLVESDGHSYSVETARTR